MTISLEIDKNFSVTVDFSYDGGKFQCFVPCMQPASNVVGETYGNAISLSDLLTEGEVHSAGLMLAEILALMIRSKPNGGS